MKNSFGIDTERYPGLALITPHFAPMLEVNVCTTLVDTGTWRLSRSVHFTSAARIKPFTDDFDTIFKGIGKNGQLIMHDPVFGLNVERTKDQIEDLAAKFVVLCVGGTALCDKYCSEIDAIVDATIGAPNDIASALYRINRVCAEFEEAFIRSFKGNWSASKRAFAACTSQAFGKTDLDAPDDKYSIRVLEDWKRRNLRDYHTPPAPVNDTEEPKAETTKMDETAEEPEPVDFLSGHWIHDLDAKTLRSPSGIVYKEGDDVYQEYMDWRWTRDYGKYIKDSDYEGWVSRGDTVVASDGTIYTEADTEYAQFKQFIENTMKFTMHG